ncbi:MAG: UDP-N-acetylmuramoyl-tripeptide--D-alanyl-D-alanine ligase [Alphaproteobacteria bacterium]|nr:UDP-N-acetylmuramoyl-tripeptide--D-alanyl-D-alanine ligase [Alphaproteobacteria bacterium]
MSLIALIGFLPFAARRLLTYLHLFQQEEYDGPRFLRWIVANQGFDRRLSLALLAAFVGQLVVRNSAPAWLFPAIVGSLCLGAATIERDPRKTGKKPLAMTTRAKRIFALAVTLTLLIGAAAALAGPWVILWAVAVQLVPLALVGGNLLLMPFEQRVQNRYWQEARAILTRMNPAVIGITGSYGKTSVKHILGHVLETAAPTLITPGSVNTAMGIARIIRERLQPHHRYFVVEMGAYGIGSIARLCALTPPKLGIISAIGKAHYERFKSLDAVSHAKFELAEAARDNGGRAIIAADVLEFPWPREFVQRHADLVTIVGETEESALHISALRQESDGIVVSVTWRGGAYELRAPLFGLHQGRNMALAFAAACELGLAPEDVVASLRSTPQIAHRLEVKPQPGGAILIDDAYNSNPVGFASALSLLDTLQQPGGRRILVTPGMVELGSEHEAEHIRIGRLAADHVDVLLAVAPHRVGPLASAFKEAAPQREVVSCATFADARGWLDRNLGGRDIVLLENDLPDLLEQKLRL